MPNLPGGKWSRPVQEESYANAAALDVSSTDATLSPTAQAIYVGIAGDLTVDLVGGATAVQFKNVPVGQFKLQVSKVYHSGTSASSLVALW